MQNLMFGRKLLLPQEKSGCSINLTVSPYQLDAPNTGSYDCLTFEDSYKDRLHKGWRGPIFWGGASGSLGSVVDPGEKRHDRIKKKKERKKKKEESSLPSMYVIYSLLFLASFA